MKQVTSYGNGRMGRSIYTTLRPVARLLIFLVCRLSVSGSEHVPVNGPLLIVSNHLSWFDPLLVVGVLPRRTWFFAKQELFAWPTVGWLARRTEQIPVHRGKSDRAALEQALAYLQEQRALLIFPEGTIAEDEQMLVAYTGVAMLALRSGATVLPVALSGTRRIWNLRDGMRPAVSVRFGEPYVPAISPDLTRKEALRTSTQEMMQRIAAMLPPEQRGAYRDLPMGEV